METRSSQPTSAQIILVQLKLPLLIHPLNPLSGESGQLGMLARPSVVREFNQGLDNVPRRASAKVIQSRPKHVPDRTVIVHRDVSSTSETSSKS